MAATTLSSTQAEIRSVSSEAPFLADDGSIIRNLSHMGGVQSVHCLLPKDGVIQACIHKTVEQIWFVIAGEGEMWLRDLKGAESITSFSVDKPMNFRRSFVMKKFLKLIGLIMIPLCAEASAAVPYRRCSVTVPDLVQADIVTDLAASSLKSDHILVMLAEHSLDNVIYPTDLHLTLSWQNRDGSDLDVKADTDDTKVLSVHKDRLHKGRVEIILESQTNNPDGLHIELNCGEVQRTDDLPRPRNPHDIDNNHDTSQYPSTRHDCDQNRYHGDDSRYDNYGERNFNHDPGFYNRGGGMSFDDIIAEGG